MCTRRLSTLIFRSVAAQFGSVSADGIPTSSDFDRLGLGFDRVNYYAIDANSTGIWELCMYLNRSANSLVCLSRIKSI